MVLLMWESNIWDWYPGHISSSRDAGGDWMKGRFEFVAIGGQKFTVPFELLKRLPKWGVLNTENAPAEGLVVPNEDPKIFAILLECVYSPSGFNGTETRLNMVKLVLAMAMASRWGMFEETTKLDHSLRRYIVRRVLYRQPFKPDFSGVLDWNYFRYRSEEIYRTWNMCQKHESLRMIISIPRLVALYATVVPHEMWPALTPDFSVGFTQLIDAFASEHEVPSETSFVERWFQFFKEADCVDYPWFDQSTSMFTFRRAQGPGGHALNEHEERDTGSDSVMTNSGGVPYFGLSGLNTEQFHQVAQHFFQDAQQHVHDDPEYVQPVSQAAHPDADPGQQAPQADASAPEQDPTPLDVLDPDEWRARQEIMDAQAIGEARFALYLRRLEERDAREAAGEAAGQSTDQQTQQTDGPVQPAENAYRALLDNFLTGYILSGRVFD
ncbi:hypothetical protein ESCO_002014 [Escovopsis weberi]|uniref:BTB domain-containing protein n=1 Tax=Escovopsis weberi TaxID=150374 RepID=A0A0M9VW88_ESCWE|nr:hypothetical protein ESCO_002014 [Escovopsis weberi]